MRLFRISISDHWQPTTDNINVLPRPLRRYIHDIENACDLAGIVRENFRLRADNEFLRTECERLARLVNLADVQKDKEKPRGADGRWLVETKDAY